MLLKMVFKIMLKAAIPLLAVVGVSSYMMYAQGGNPMELLARVSGGVLGDVGQQSTGLLDSARKSSSSMLSSMSSGNGGSSSQPDTVYQWKDENGVTHFGTKAPTGVAAKTKIIDPNRNMIAATKAAKPMQPKVPTAASADQERLPGMGGVALDGIDASAFLKNRGGQ